MAKKPTTPEADWLAALPRSYRMYIEVSGYIRDEMPNFHEFMHTNEGDFRGLTITPGSAGGFLLILKRWGDEGKPEILFSSEDSPLGCFIYIEDALQRGNWKEDKKKPS